MMVYNIQLISIFLISFIAELLKRRKVCRKILYYLCFFIMLLMSGLRYYVGTDYANYNYIFNNINNMTLKESNIEIGYYFLNKVIRFFSENEASIFITVSFIILYLVFLTIMRDSNKPELSLFLFISMYFYSSSFNMMRQYISISIIFYATRYIIEKNFSKYLKFVILASMFHISALIMIPFYFLLNYKYSYRQYFILFLLSIIGVYILPYALGVASAIIPKLSAYKGSIFMNKGISILNIVPIIIPFTISLIFKDKIIKINKSSEVYINAIFFSFLITTMSLKFIFLYRFSIYVYIYSIILIPQLIDLFSYKFRPILYLLIISFYNLIYIGMLSANYSHVIPYKLRL